MKTLFTALLLCLLPAILQAEETFAERKLTQLVDEEQRILNGTRRADGSYDETILKRRYQGLAQQFDAFIQENPDFPTGYVAYARMLERIGNEDAAYGFYLQANRLDPNIPLVKNQIGNRLTESGDYAGALPYYLAAIELAPREPIYHYQLGSLLAHFRQEFVADKMFTDEVLDEKLLTAFREASRHAPNEIAFSYRYAEAFYDLKTPRWDDALEAWKKMETRVNPGIEQETVLLQQANVLLEQKKPGVARAQINRVKEPVLEKNKRELLKRVDALEEKESESPTAQKDRE